MALSNAGRDLEGPGRIHGNYNAYRGRRLVRSNVAVGPLATATEYVHTCFRSAVLSRGYSCLGAKAALRRGAYRFGFYPSMGTAEATAGLAGDLELFIAERPLMPDGFQSFVASFAGAPPSDERAFEASLWTQLQQLHDGDALHHAWDPSVSSDPADPAFSFSFAGTAFFVVGLHPMSSRLARRFAWPTLIFNPHDQFARLREAGRFTRLRDAIRRREMALQGNLNSNLSDYGTASEARQYSGRAVETDWKCPFHPQNG